MSKQIEIVDKFDEIRKTVAKDNIFVEKSGTNHIVISSDVTNDDILIPKDPVEILNELKPGIIIKTEQLKSSKTVMALVKIGENTFVEYGKSHSLAVQAVAESALKDLFFEQIKSTMFNDDDFQYSTNSWKLLGNLAMFKLIEEWMKFYMSNNNYKSAFEPEKATASSNNLLNQNQDAKTISKNDCTSKKQDSLCKNVQSSSNNLLNQNQDAKTICKNDITSKKQDSLCKNVQSSPKNLLNKKQDTKTVSKNDCTSEKQNSLCKSIKEDSIQKKKQQSIINKDKSVDSNKKNSSQKLLANKILTNDTNACSILNELVRSNFKFVDLQLNNDQPPFKFSVIVDNTEFISDFAGSKKEAKQNVAKKVLIKKFGYRLRKE